MAGANKDSYASVAINAPDDYDQLEALLDLAYEPQVVIDALKASISPSVKSVFLEFDYIDKDYRSTFYNFYAKKGRPYRSDCVRLHFFDVVATFAADRADLVVPDGRPQDHYYGYIVLRPTLFSTIGRSILSPDIREGARGLSIQAQHSLHLLGHKLKVWGFPSMAQHTDIAVCAHVSCWAILRHYSERFSQHRELLIHEITKLAQPFDPGGLTPSLGLNVLQAERIFQAAGSYPVIVNRAAVGQALFRAQLIAYLESGFPLFIAMGGHGHAIVAIGYSWVPTTTITAPLKSSLSSELVSTILAVDDNDLPYISVSKASGAKYSIDDFTGFIVPLPDKIYYPADAVEKQSVALYDKLSPILDLPAANDVIRRYFVTTVSGLRRFARKYQSQLGDVLVGAIMRLRSTQFVWVVEYASAEQWNNGHIAGRAILDATASLYDPVPVWFVHDEQKAVFFDRTESTTKANMLKLQRQPNTPLGRMEQNLRPVKKPT